MQIQNLIKEHSRQTSKLHISGIPTGFISSLGKDFVCKLYESISCHGKSFGFVAIEDDKVLGFVSFTESLSSLYRYVLIRKGLKFAFILASKLLSIGAFKKIWSNIFYPKKMKDLSLPDAELLSIVVSKEGRGNGIAKKLIDEGLLECQKRGIKEVKVLVAADNEAANKLYQKCGFKLNTTLNNHGQASNIYTIVLGQHYTS